MPRWKALPDELDPQVKEFSGQLRRLVDRSGLSIAALADRTGYSKTSWERYLGGRLLAPKGAVVALAEVTGTDLGHLTTMWELAERAWSRSEMRHDMTMEASRISQARAALGEFGPPAATGAGATRAARFGGSATVTPGIAGPAGVSPTIPPQPTAPDADAREAAGNGRVPNGRAAPGPHGEPPRRPESPSEGRRRLTMFVAGALAALTVVAAVFFLTDGGGKGAEGAARSPSPSATTRHDLPPGVKCAGGDCTGKDAESMGCSGDLVSTVKTAAVGTTVVEVRYSRTCRAAWGRITGAAPGDTVRVSAGAHHETGTVARNGDTIAYTPMTAVPDASEVKACVTLTSGRRGCTK
ncbi:helix-turn-helix domain-containing protein [Streptomyces sp. NPDC001480]|uniref:helix-turn-helix domain-containing protein n=1 Tax=Streptomyces sp. NPDC001480 TaxID=3364577 RepID=UPI0036776065